MIVKIFFFTLPLFFLIGCAKKSDLKKLEKGFSEKVYSLNDEASDLNYDINKLENNLYKEKKKNKKLSEKLTDLENDYYRLKIASNHNYEGLLENDKSIKNDLSNVASKADSKFIYMRNILKEHQGKVDAINLQRDDRGICIALAPNRIDDGNVTITLLPSIRPSWIKSRCNVEKIINYGSTFGALSQSCKSKSRGDKKFAKYFKFIPNSNSVYTIDLIANTDTYLFLLDKNGNELSRNDDYGGHSKGSNSRIEQELKNGEIYYIEATTYNNGIAIGIEIIINK